MVTAACNLIWDSVRHAYGRIPAPGKLCFPLPMRAAAGTWLEPSHVCLHAITASVRARRLQACTYSALAELTGVRSADAGVACMTPHSSCHPPAINPPLLPFCQPTGPLLVGCVW